MEPITLCGAIIVAFGLWVEFEPVIMRVARAISTCCAIKTMPSPTVAQQPLYLRNIAGISH
jgi:hypothetical protein